MLFHYKEDKDWVHHQKITLYYGIAPYFMVHKAPLSRTFLVRACGPIDYLSGGAGAQDWRPT